MTLLRPSWLVPLASALGGSVGCSYNAQVVGSRGEVYTTNTWSAPAAERPALIGSASHDLPCAPDRLRVVVDPISDVGSHGMYVVEGCSARVTYIQVIVNHKVSLILLARVPTEAALK